MTFQSLDLKFLPVSNDGVVTQTAEARVQKVRAGTAERPATSPAERQARGCAWRYAARSRSLVTCV